MMNYTDFLSNLRASGHYALGVGVHNAVTAGLAERAGFDALWLSSLEVSTAKLLPDINLINLTEVASILREIRQATTLPIIVDADNGYGSDETAIRAAQEFTFAGATAICFEDNAFPKRGSFYEGVSRRLEDTDTFCRRIERVRQAVEGHAEIIARTEGLIAGLSVSETIKRVHAYVEAGANAVFIQTNKARAEDFFSVLSEVRMLAPIVITPTTLPETPASEFHAQGVDVIIYSNVVMRTIARTVSQTLTDLREKQFLGSVTDQIAPLEDLFELTHVGDWIDRSQPGEEVLHDR
ncbi:MAG TPA: isocitrate lyase/phosphoenolpyruvate mutase family protein [Ktedonobacteraceae bacterium]|nr:isocitrate lyase/phosphoenolpyruvate mutase family protein [Ktedonobacteraceae bacterium]